MDSAARGRAEIVSIDFIFGNLRSGHLVLQYTLLSLSTSHHPSVSHVQLLLTRRPPRCLLSSILWLFFMILSPLSFSTSFLSLACVILHLSIQLSSSASAPFLFHFLSRAIPPLLLLFFSVFFFIIPLVFLSPASLCGCF